MVVSKGILRIPNVIVHMVKTDVPVKISLISVHRMSGEVHATAPSRDRCLNLWHIERNVRKKLLNMN